MNRDDLEKKRFWPCFNEIWTKATNVFPDDFPTLSYELLQELCPWTQDGDRQCLMVPIDITWMDKDEMKKIVDKWCKGLHGFWYYTLKLDFEDPEYEARCKELHDFRDFEAEVYKDKTLTYAQRAAKIRKEALAHNFRWRSRDKEIITTSIYLGASPTSNKEHYEIGQVLFDFLRQYLDTDELPMVYHDYTKDKEFPYAENDKLYTARIENIRWDRDNNTLVSHGINHKICNLYDSADEFVRDIWDYEPITRSMSASTFRTMADMAIKLVDDHIDELPQAIRDIKELNNGTARWYKDIIEQPCACLVMLYRQYHKTPEHLSDKPE